MPDSSFSKIAIIGLGYVGLPLGLQFARSGLKVLGLDVDLSKVEAINEGRSYIKHISAEHIQQQHANGHLQASTDFTRIEEVGAILICVPTPLNKNREPDISFILETGRAIAPHLQKGALVVLESTTYPGTTDSDLRAVLEQGSELKAGEEFHLAYSPEREDPGSFDRNVAKIPKVIGGYTENCRLRADELYSQAIEQTVPVSSCRTAEATKLMENIFRSVNIALVNELKQVFNSMDIDIWEVINAAKTKPFGYMPFYPGPGLGGHCIPIDPFYLTWKAREYHQATRFVELAGEINTNIANYVVDRVSIALNDKKMAIKGSKVLIVGLAYKSNVDDDRESSSYRLMDLLKARGATISYYDPHISVIRKSRQHAKWAGYESVTWSKSIIRAFDAVLIATKHTIINFQIPSSKRGTLPT